MTTETTPNTSTGSAAPLHPAQSALKPANGKRRRALLILLAVVLALNVLIALVRRWRERVEGSVPGMAVGVAA